MALILIRIYKSIYLQHTPLSKYSIYTLYIYRSVHCRVSRNTMALILIRIYKSIHLQHTQLSKYSIYTLNIYRSVHCRVSRNTIAFILIKNLYILIYVWSLWPLSWMRVCMFLWIRRILQIPWFIDLIT